MSVYISLLRGINVGGSKIMSMDSLCEIYAGLRFNHIRSYLQSGNVIFASGQDDPSRLTSQIEARIEQMCGFHVKVFIRLLEDFQAILANNPFLSQTTADISKLHVSFLYQVPDETAWGKIVIPGELPDKLSRGDKAIYLFYPNGYAKAKISTHYLETVLGVALTNRNWNTVNALYKIAVDTQDSQL
jgi:uncharacterized protein (DUF1697 family)